MTQLQRLRPTCDEHDGCHAIECVTDEPITDEDGNVIHEAGTVLWVSHAPDTTHPDCRANPDHPMEGYDPKRPMCRDCAEVFGNTAGQSRMRRMLG